MCYVSVCGGAAFLGSECVLKGKRLETNDPDKEALLPVRVTSGRDGTKLLKSSRI